MIKIAFILATLVAIMFFAFCNKFKGPQEATEKLTKLASLPKEVEESSGILKLPEQEQYLTHNDAGNKPYLYQIDSKGNIQQTHKLSLPNVDWEDLSSDTQGNIYIADTGNNANKRKELAVYKAPLNNLNKLQAIRFSYEDQKEFPPKKKDRNFDSEAIFWHGGSLYIISKDRGRGETAKVYRLPDQPGQHQAKLIGKININSLITSADVSPAGDQVVLLSEGKLHLFNNVSNIATFYEQDYQDISFPGTGQTEAVAFEDANTLIITSEGGNLYRYSLN
ncbi:hypothetical protein [Pontibacter harenae]|uniref:hypothetical protein n=1 Tax=Pontibacter harenae TaxID=2894083 RepID=UPI001E42501C|nr:hypothetical protein [Pontibacter harenae]